MCGITALVSNQAQTERAETIQKMTDALQHRGPDDEGFYHDDQVSLGQRRLSINDVAGGHQPLFDDTGNLVMVANGEIYNSPQLRADLEAEGYAFKTHTDVEVILPLYQKYGADCVKHLRGMFAFAIWNKQTQAMFFARDHMGQKPIFFSMEESTLRIASEVKSLLKAQDAKPEIDMTCLWHYISMRFVPDDLSFFKNVHKLEAGHWALWEKGEVKIERYWDIDFKEKQTASFAAIEEQLNDVLLDTVKSHLLSDVPVGAFLSGGIDSSTVSAMMAQLGEGALPVFSIGVEEAGFNELPWARKVVDQYGMDGHEKVVSADLIHLIPKMIHHMDEPSDPFGVGVYLVSEMAREHVKVVLTGDGGDEGFAGYDRFAGQRLAEYYGMMPKWLRQQVFGRMIKLVPDTFGYKSAAQKIKWLHDMSFYKSGDRYVQSLTFLRFTHEAKLDLFTDEALAQIDDKNSADKVLRHFDAENTDDLVDRMLYSDMMTRLPDHLLMISDRMTMAHSLESRAPFVDHKLLEFAATIPTKMKLKGLGGDGLKHILRKTASRYLPKDLIYREKQGFGFPIARWMRTDLNHFLTNLFKESRFVELGIFRQEVIDQYLKEHLEGISDHNFRLWILLNLEMWYRIYFEEMDMDAMNALTDRLMRAA